MLGTAFDEAQVLRPEKRRLNLTREVHGAPGDPVDPDRLRGSLTLLGNAEGELDRSTPGLDDGFHQRVGGDGADQVRFTACPR